jgi:methyl coenzyme M reductase subunit C-like uncharacterized protein (methanogenesis marker protein 7)
MEATIPAQSESAKEWTDKLKEASGFALSVIQKALPKLVKEDDMIIYPFFKMKDDVDKKDFGMISDMAEPFVMEALRNGLTEEELDKYFFAYLRNGEKYETLIGARLKTEKDKQNLAEMKKEEDAKLAAEKAEEEAKEKTNALIGV